MFRIFALSFFCVTASHAAPSDLIREHGLQGAIDRQSDQATLTDDDRLALGGMTFLRAAERAYQLRWRVGLTQSFDGVPFLRGALPANPAPEEMNADVINQLFEQALSDMRMADDILAEIGDGADPVFKLALSDLWFDVNQNGQRDPSENFGDIALNVFMSPWQIRQWERDRPADAPNPLQATIRFDRSDIHWLRAYTQALSGVSEFILAFDPSPEIAQALAVRQAIGAQIAETGTAPANWVTSDDALWVDVIATLIDTLRHDPDPQRIRNAHAHLLAMIDHNRAFWAALDRETDDDREWIPNANQTAALGFLVPAEMGDAWQEILTDLEKMLTGELLIGHWRFSPEYGISAQAYVDDPVPLSLIGWFQGTDAVAYARRGPRISNANMRTFEEMTRGGTGLFMILFN